MSAPTRPDIVVVAIDTLRADHASCYGYPKATTPAIDALASEALLFETAIAPGIPTTPSFTTFYTGLHPLRHGIVAHVGRHRLSADVAMLPELAKRAGYATAAFDNLVIQGGGSGSWFARGYDHYSGYVYKPFGSQSEALTDRAMRALEETRDAPLLLFLHLWDPHTPYGPLAPFDTLHYRPGGPYPPMEEVRAISPEYYDAFLGDMHLAHPDDYGWVVAQYDGEITQADAQVARLLDVIERRGRKGRTVVVVMGDHGECFGEGGLHFDHHGLYDAVVRVPLVMRVPGVAPGRVPALVSSEDIMPTLAELGGFELPPYPLTGRSLGPLLRDPGRPWRDAIVLAESSRQCSIGLRTADRKLIVPVVTDARGAPVPDVYGRERSPEPELYDLVADPGEAKDVAQERPEEVAAMRARLEQEMTAIGAGDGWSVVADEGASLPYDQFMARILGRR